jgi:protein ImuB
MAEPIPVTGLPGSRASAGNGAQLISVDGPSGRPALRIIDGQRERGADDLRLVSSSDGLDRRAALSLLSRPDVVKGEERSAASGGRERVGREGLGSVGEGPGSAGGEGSGSAGGEGSAEEGEAEPAVTRKRGRRVRAVPALPPWPGRLPKPAPAVVLRQPVGAVVVDAAGEAVRVSARLELTGTPVALLVERAPAVEIVGWAGPWPVEERWWAAAEMRRRARFQVALADGRAMLLSLAGGHWVVEAVYD